MLHQALAACSPENAMESSHIKIVKDICEGKDTCEIRPTSDMFGVRKQEGKWRKG